MSEDMNNKNITVAVLKGGQGDEREVSLESGKCVANALADGGYNVIESDINSQNLEILDNNTIDVFFLALHGSFGEDGTLQKILEDKNLKYTGSNSNSSRLAFDKILTKRFLKENNILTPNWIEVCEYPKEKHLGEEIRQLGKKYILKPSQQGSSVGIEILEDPLETARAAAVGLARFGNCLIEEFIQGREITVGIVGSNSLPIIEIVSKGTFYDYNAKYKDDKTEFLFDTIKDINLQEQIKKTAMRCFELIGCRHFSRVDFLVDEMGDAYFLEINTLPGMTSHSLLPKAAAKIGMNMTDLCSNIVEQAIAT